MSRTKKEIALLLFCWAFALLALGFSFWIQFVQKIEPCRLCKLQRLPYFGIALFPLLGLMRLNFNKIRVGLICLFGITALLATYHLCVIGGLIQDFCAVKGGIESIDDFMLMIDSHVPCSKSEWRLLGLPMPVYSLIVSSMLILMIIKQRNKEIIKDF